MFMPSVLDNLWNNIIIKKGKGNVGAINPKFALTTMTEALRYGPVKVLLWSR